MIRHSRLLVCAVISVVAHVAVERWLQRLPPGAEFATPRKVEIRVLMPPPPDPTPEPPKPAEPPPAQPPPRVVHERVRKPVVAEQQAETPKSTEAPPPDHPPITTDTSATPVFGVTMESTSQAGTGPAMPVGNTVRPRPGQQPVADAPVKALAAPVAAYQVTKMPLPEGRCTAKYTEEAREAADEGTVILDLIVGEDGRTREITVVQGLPHGLDKAAIAALKSCRFTPGEKDGRPVPVRVRGFKVSFYLQDAQ